MRVVLDTNVIVSSVINKHGYSVQIRSLWKNGSIEVATSEPILNEVKRVLNYPHIQKRHHWSPERIEHFVAGLRSNAIIASGNTPINAVKDDPDDNKFFACAVEMDIHYIVRGDEKHVLPIGEYQGIHCVSPRDFVENFVELKKAA